MTIGETLSKAIKEKKWVEITYLNKNGEKTTYWIAIKDINSEKKTFHVSMFNNNKSLNTFESWISFERILSAMVIDLASYENRFDLAGKIESDLEAYDWLQYDMFNFNILNYYAECNYLDCDPSQKEYTCIDGIDLALLRKNKKISLNEIQEKRLIADIYKYDLKKADKKMYTLAINCFSIDMGKNKYVIAYYILTFNPEKRELVIDQTLRFNKSFLIEGRRHSLFNYVTMNLDDFTDDFINNFNDYQEMIIGNLRNGEMINTRPDIMLIERENVADLSSIYDYITEKYINNELNTPLKSFFGNIAKRNYIRRKEPSLVLYDKRININQMRVLYNAMKFPVTYVQGPPGTGKTQTIINVVISAFYNGKKTLVCSSNNKPVDGIVSHLVFKYKNEQVNFPYLRLGNFDDVKRATKKIKELFNFSTTQKPIDSLLNKIIITNDDQTKTLSNLLDIQEKRIDIEDCLENSQKLLSAFKDKRGKVIDVLTSKIEQLKKDLDNYPTTSNKDIVDLFKPLSENYLLQQYMYFKSIQYIQKLKLPRYHELIDICSIEDDDERATQFNSWTENDDNIRLLTDAFPIIFSTNISSRRLGRAEFMFDLVIMDEAGQCNVATALIPISKADSLLLVGDPNQLKPVIVLENEVNENLKKKYNISEKYDYKNHSILDIMIETDKISKYILLKYHYRCGRKIIDFSNQRYYNNALNLSYVERDGALEVLDVKNKNIKQKNEALEEATAIVDYLQRNKTDDAFIITPFVNQKDLITKMLSERGIKNIECGTIHSMQGAEKGTIIISPAISYKTSKNTFKWIKSNYELINVAVTRAKDKLIIATDKEVLEHLSDKKDDLYNLVKYATNNGKIIVPKNESVKLEIGLSNGSKFEDEFYETISHFCTCHKYFAAERNVKINKLFKNDPYLANNEQEFDLVLYNQGMFKKTPEIAFETNGGEHLGSVSRERSDNKKMEICKSKGIKLIFIPNSYVKAYEYIASIIMSLKDDKPLQESIF